MARQVVVERIYIELPEENFFIFLKDTSSQEGIPIYIDPLAAQSIQTVLDGVKWSRPNAHDLFCNTISELAVVVDRVLITKLEQDAFFAQIILIATDYEPPETRVIDARPSDAVAIALRSGAPIFVEEEVFTQAGAYIDADYDLIKDRSPDPSPPPQLPPPKQKENIPKSFDDALKDIDLDPDQGKGKK